MFWSSKNTTKRCKYFFSVDEVPAATEVIEEKENIFMGGATIPHIIKQVKRKEISSNEEASQSVQKRRKVATSTSEDGPMVVTTSVTMVRTCTGTSYTSSAALSGRPLKIGKDPFEKSRITKEKPTSNQLSDSLSVTQDTITGKSSVSLQQSQKKPLAALGHKSSPHKIIPQPGGLLTTYEVPLNTMKSSIISQKPRLIQPKLRYEVVPTVLQPDVSGSNIKRPILPKVDQPVVAIARHVQYHLNSNPQMLNYIGDATLQGLHQVLGMTYQCPVSPIPLHVDSCSTFMPCYTLNLPDAFWRTYAGQVQSSPPIHRFEVQTGLCVAKKGTKTDSSCQTDAKEHDQAQHIDCNIDKRNESEKCSKDNQFPIQSKRRLDMDTAAEKCVHQAGSLHEGNHDLVINTKNNDNKQQHVVKDTSACTSSKPHRTSECSPLNNVHAVSDDNTLPNIRHLIDGFSDTPHFDMGKELDNTQYASKNSDEMSPLSLQNISELSCLQAAAHLAKLMPEIFDEKSKIPNTELSSSGRCELSSPVDSMRDVNSDCIVTDVSTSSAVSIIVADGKPDGKKSRKWYQKRMKKLLGNERQQKSRLRVTVKNEDGLLITGTSIQGILSIIQAFSDKICMDFSQKHLFSALEPIHTAVVLYQKRSHSVSRW